MTKQLVVFLSAGQIDYIMTALGQRGRKYDWALVHELEEQTGGKFGKNYSWQVKK